jgi:hypothetical protein
MDGLQGWNPIPNIASFHQNQELNFEGGENRTKQKNALYC